MTTTHDTIEDLAETVAEVVAAFAEGGVDVAEAVKLASKAVMLLAEIPLQRPKAALLKAAGNQERRAVRLRSRGHDKAADRHEKRAKALREKASERS